MWTLAFSKKGSQGHPTNLGDLLSCELALTSHPSWQRIYVVLIWNSYIETRKGINFLWELFIAAAESDSGFMTHSCLQLLVLLCHCLSNFIPWLLLLGSGNEVKDTCQSLHFWWIWNISKSRLGFSSFISTHGILLNNLKNQAEFSPEYRGLNWLIRLHVWSKRLLA